MSRNREQLIELYLSASSVPGLMSFSFVGPFGSRVSFASQQRRAINTVWAVCEEKIKGKAAPKVAVVGAGIAGLMTSAALVSRGCIVTLIEKRGDVADIQRRTQHRYVHPTINFWPEIPLCSTTALPFLDWYEDTCSHVVATIVSEWRANFAGRMKPPMFGSEVTKIAQVGQKGRLELRTERLGKEIEHEFDHVFITTGFGDEKTIHEGDASYWDWDSADQEIALGRKKFVIGGIGDGGLIECLRILNRNFESGTLCLKVARIIDGLGLRNSVTEIDKYVRATATDEFHSSVLFYERYVEFCKDLPTDVTDILRLRNAVEVTLVGTLPQPFKFNSASIHKLIIAQALTDGALQYITGKLEATGPGATVKRRSRRPWIPNDDCKIIGRIGPNVTVGGLLTDVQRRSLQLAQQQLADLLEIALEPLTYFSGHGASPVFDPTAVAYVDSRYEKVSDYFYRHHYRAWTKVSLDDERPIYEVQKNSMTDAPSSIFGVPVKFGYHRSARGL